MSNLVRSILLFMVCTVVVHTLYITFIHPQANELLAVAAANGEAAPRSFIIIIKDLEQEICIILMLVCMSMIIGKAWRIDADMSAHDNDDIKHIINQDGSLDHIQTELREKVFQHHGGNPLCQTIDSCIERFLITRDVHNASQAIDSSIDALAMRLDSENSMIRYLIWAIPSLGFIGTVRGIGEALGLADEALAGDISGMTEKLGVAFNSTLVALVISIILMFLLHQLQRLQDKLVVETQGYCERTLLPRFSRRS